MNDILAFPFRELRLVLDDTVSVGEQVRLARQENDRHDVPRHHSFTVMVTEGGPAYGRGLRIIRSNSDRYPAHEEWELPLRSLSLSVWDTDEDTCPITAVKKFRLWMALRSILREEQEAFRAKAKADENLLAVFSRSRPCEVFDLPPNS